jgi:hypothetical protein
MLTFIFGHVHLHAFDYIINHMKMLKIIEFDLLDYKKKAIFLGYLVDFLYSLSLRFITWNVGHMCKK